MRLWIDNLKSRSHKEGLERFVSLLECNPNAKLLDIGCGDGSFTKALISRISTDDATGIDANNGNPPFKFIKQDIDNGLPFKSETFDVITASHVIEHVKDTDLFVNEIYRVLKPGGYAVIATPNMANGRIILELLRDRQPTEADVSDYLSVRRRFSDKKWWRESWGHLHRRLFTMEGITRLFTRYGFKIEHKEREGYGRFFFGKALRGLYATRLLIKVRKVG